MFPQVFVFFFPQSLRGSDPLKFWLLAAAGDTAYYWWRQEQAASKAAEGFANLSVYKERYRSLLKSHGWGVGGKMMPKNSWASWKVCFITAEKWRSSEG